MKEGLRITSKLLKAMRAAKVINSSFVFRRSRRRGGIYSHATDRVDVLSNFSHTGILTIFKVREVFPRLKSDTDQICTVKNVMVRLNQHHGPYVYEVRALTATCFRSTLTLILRAPLRSGSWGRYPITYCRRSSSATSTNDCLNEFISPPLK